MRILHAAALAAVALWGCRWSDVPAGAVYACNDGQCPQGYTCRDQHCFPAAVDCAPATAADACADAGAACGLVTAADGCGANRVYTCEACAAGSVCRQNACCQSPTPKALCADAGFACGRLNGVDACGAERSVNCGDCDVGQVCTPDSTGTACGPCTPEADQAFCDRQGANCGYVDAGDNCGFTRTAFCGDCADGGCSTVVQNLCACQPTLAGCLQGSQCCTGTCGDAGLCCVAPLGACSDDADCCLGSCAQSFCEAASTNDNGR